MERGARGTLWWHLLLLLAVSALYESVFLHHGLNRFDEGWPLHAAMRLHAGGTLYEDVFFVFPPGHLLPAWIAYALDPPGIVLARGFYAAFDVALCLALYLLGRRLMPPTAALAGALLLAVAAPSSHVGHLLFGYRYLVFPVLALLCFAERLRSGNPRWLLAAGALTGVALCFRLTPAFAVGCGVAVGIATSDPSPRRWLRDGMLFAAGLAVAALPVLIWLASEAGLGTTLREAVLRPVAMTEMQDKPLPPLDLPRTAKRVHIGVAFASLQLRLWAMLYLGLAAMLLIRFVRTRLARRPFDDALLAATVVFGGVYWLRTLGRTDVPHLDSALPPVCLLLAYAVSTAVARVPEARRRAVAAGAWALVFGIWIFLPGADRVFDPEFRGKFPIQSLAGSVRSSYITATSADFSVLSILRETQRGDTVLDLSASPLHLVIADRMGPGGADIVIPGTFLTKAEESDFLERLRHAPPALVLWTDKPFDQMPERSVEVTAPDVTAWVHEHYRPGPSSGRLQVLLPKEPDS